MDVLLHLTPTPPGAELLLGLQWTGFSIARDCISGKPAAGQEPVQAL